MGNKMMGEMNKNKEELKTKLNENNETFWGTGACTDKKWNGRLVSGDKGKFHRDVFEKK